jgi:hypothetical protein
MSIDRTKIAVAEGADVDAVEAEDAVRDEEDVDVVAAEVVAVVEVDIFLPTNLSSCKKTIERHCKKRVTVTLHQFLLTVVVEQTTMIKPDINNRKRHRLGRLALCHGAGENE